MDLSNLSPPDGANRKEKRVGRGSGSGHGKTCGRGTKGQKARSGGQIPPHFEGGQTPIYRRLPKFGFTNPCAEEVAIVNVGDLAQRFDDGDTVDIDTLEERGLVNGKYDVVKILGDGELDVELTVSANRFSESAREKIEQAGGSAEVV